jgi:indolepyruvate ferredoxin oxidoreductase alpha subunit
LTATLLSGNEALALGAYAGGATFAAGYPGTPSTEILEAFATLDGVYAEWSPNEKVALEVALGASLAGARSLVTMKHVGLNVAADPLFTIAYTGVDAGLVVVTADDPGMYSSQNEQDNRWYARAAHVPMLEPSTPQEAYDMALRAFELSEAWDMPVLIRTVTRLAHSKRLVVERAGSRARAHEYTSRPEKYVMMPSNAKRRRVDLDSRLALSREVSETDGDLNRVEWRDRTLGIVTSGVVYTHVREAAPEASVLKLGLSYPLPERMIQAFAAGCERVAVIEELDPLLETDLRAMGVELVRVTRPMMGPLDSAAVRAALGGEVCAAGPSVAAELPPRPPLLCPGCPHRGVFYALHKRKAIVMGDIGCYTLGALPPLSSMDMTVCMGASIGAAHGFAKAGGHPSRPVVAVIGDSTFMHSGLTGLLDVAYNAGDVPVIVLDNRTTAMTGRQPNPASGEQLQRGDGCPDIDLADLARAMGIGHAEVVEPSSLAAIDAVLDRALAHDGPSFIAFRKPCVLLERPQEAPMRVDADACSACGRCVRIGCPALSKDGAAMVIDETLCTGCALCAQVCQDEAIHVVEVSDGA